MTKVKPSIQRTVVILLCIIVVIVGAMVSRILRTPDSTVPQEQQVFQPQEALQKTGVFVRPQPKALAKFVLTDEQGQPFGNDRFTGQRSGAGPSLLVLVGYVDSRHQSTGTAEDLPLLHHLFDGVVFGHAD